MDSVNTLPFFGIKEGDLFTIAGIGYDKSGQLIQGGHYASGPRKGQKTRAKIVKLSEFKAGKATVEVMPCALS